MITFRKATEADIQTISRIYDDIHTAEECGTISTGWIRNVYPTGQTAWDALKRGDLFVGEEGNRIVGAAIINQQQVDAYKDGNWHYPAPDNEIMVLHTLVIDPALSGKGYGREFVGFYETYAVSQDCHYLRMDTQEKNRRAREMYQKLGYREIGLVPCTFNGIKGVRLVLLEKYINS